MLRGKQAAAAVMVAMSLALSAGGAAASAGKSSATISGSFTDSCRDFAAHSSKDVSHVELHYADGRVVKDERIVVPDYAINGGPGDELGAVIVKSGTTSERFDCARANGPPTALLEIKTPDDPECGYFVVESELQCLMWTPRTVWRSEFPIGAVPGDTTVGEADLYWLCDLGFACPTTFSFRGTGSTDPDADITIWSLDFGDGGSASGSWSTDPPAEVTHEYGPEGPRACAGGYCTVTLTVTDAAGQSDSDAITMGLVDVTPD